MGHAGQLEVGDLLPDVEMHHLALACGARRAHQFGVVLGEKEVVERFGEEAAARIEEAGDEGAFLVLVVVHHADRDVVGLRVVADLPDLGHVLQRGDEALARRRVIHGGNARAFLALLIPDLMHLEQIQIGVEQHQGVRQVVGHREVLAVAGDGDVARVDAGADLRHHLEVPDVELGDPAVARGEEDIAPVGREFRSAVQRVAAGEAVDRFQLVAVEHRDVVVAGFDHDEQVHHVHALEDIGGFGRQAAGREIGHARSLDIGCRKSWRWRHGGVDVLGQRGDLVLVQTVGEAQHLGRRAAGADGLDRLGLPQPRQALRQQRRAGQAEPAGAVADRAMLLVERRCIGGAGARCKHGDGQQAETRGTFPEADLPGRCRLGDRGGGEG